jgi:hypothetical protein
VRPPRRPGPARNRAKILAAAEDLFAARSAADVTMEDIARAAGAVGAIVLGVVVTKDPLSVGRVAALALIVGGVVLARVT